MKVNFVERTIELTAKEMKQASMPHTCEYMELISVMQELPHFEIRVNCPRITHNANRGLTYAAMEQYIVKRAPEKMNDFHVVRSTGGYPMTTKWFRMEFPEHVEGICVNSSHSLVA